MSYRNDDDAHGERATALIDEIGKLERQKVDHAKTESRLEQARRELSTLQAHAPAPEPEKRPGLITHVLVFVGTAGAAFLGYTLLF